MHPHLAVFLFIIAGISIVAAWRLFAIYRRRMRWKALMTSHQSLHVARSRIIVSRPPSDED